MQVAQLAKSPDQFLLLVVRADRIAHRNPAPPFNAVHEECASARTEQQRLVAEQRQIGLAVFFVGDHRPGALHLFDRGRVRLLGGRPKEALNREEEQQTDDADRGAQEAGRVGAEGEVPPEVARIFDVLVAEESEPGRGDQDQQNCGDPSRPESFVQQRRLAVEVTPRRDEREQHHAEDDRFFEIAAFENLEEDARAEYNHGELIRGVKAPLQSAG